MKKRWDMALLCIGLAAAAVFGLMKLNGVARMAQEIRWSILDEQVVGLDLKDAELLRQDGHPAGFLGDREEFRTYRLTEESRAGADEVIANSKYWHRLPLSENCRRITQRLALDDDHEPYFPEVTDGWYFFLDRHDQATDPADDTDVYLRGSWNLTMAVYDPATGSLHYYFLNT